MHVALAAYFTVKSILLTVFRAAATSPSWMVARLIILSLLMAVRMWHTVSVDPSVG